MQLNWNELKCGWRRMESGKDTGDVPTVAAPAMTVDLSGTWHLADCRTIYPGGKTARPWAGCATGCLFYAPDGHMFETLSYPDRSGVIRCTSYCGQYEVVEDRVYHFVKISADIRDVGTVLERTFVYEQDLLTLFLSPAPGGGPGSSMEYCWRRAEIARREKAPRHRVSAGKSFYPAR